VAAKGLFYPPDPGSQVISTIGGNVMECSGGLRGLKYGITRDYVLGMEAVLMGGRVLRVGGKLSKDVAGYDLVRLLVGSEGTLAVLSEITLKLLPAPEAKATGAAYFLDLEASARSVSRIIEKRILPATLEFLDQATMRVVDESAGLGLPSDAGAMLIFGQDGHAPMVERDTAAMAEICREEGAISVEVAADEDAAGKLLAARRGAIPALARLAPTLILEDVTVPRSELPAMVRDVQAIAAEEGLLIAVFGHAGDGNLHPTCCIDDRDPDEVARATSANEASERWRCEMSAFASTAGTFTSLTKRTSSWTSLSSASLNGSSSSTTSMPLVAAYSPAWRTLPTAISQIAGRGKTSPSQKYSPTTSRRLRAPKDAAWSIFALMRSSVKRCTEGLKSTRPKATHTCERIGRPTSSHQPLICARPASSRSRASSKMS
jgi:hypothetical protein